MYLYIVVSANGLFKIGKTTNINARFAQIKTASPVECSLLFFTKYDEEVVDLEKKYHAEFDNKRVRGEWFDLSKSDLLPIIGEGNTAAHDVLDSIEVFGKFAFYAAMDNRTPSNTACSGRVDSSGSPELFPAEVSSSAKVTRQSTRR